MTSEPEASVEASESTSSGAHRSEAVATSAPAPDAPAGRPRAAASSANRAVLVVPALLVVALALLIVGLVTSTSAWLAASLVASVLAAVLLVIERIWQARKASSKASAETAAAGPATPEGSDPEPPIDLDAPAIDPDDPEAVWVVDGRPRYHLRDCATIASLEAEPISRTQALEDGFVACSLCAPAATT